ncbi:hypothetical protein BHYA_0015g00650 [Botrytis hyacinthi]|uniref:Uncharacterized protein n=1 Tax=Botrytis hyacinthi TaxID=278943 RepID=A0A4Z1H2R7_9HELO|nr:hypothetical protein BHYA_0015g00650 [Botrytis hyacinthi]
MLYRGSMANVIFVNKRHPLTVYDNLALIDLPNTTTSLAIYESSYDPIIERTLQRKQESFRNQYCSHKAAANDSVAPVEISMFECRTMMEKAMKMKLEEAAAKYQVKKNEHEMKKRERGEDASWNISAIETDGDWKLSGLRT